MFNKKIAVLLCLALVAMFFATATTGEEEIAATVNGTEITMLEFEETLNESLWSYGISVEGVEQQSGESAVIELKNNLLDMMIQREALYQEAVKRGLGELSEQEREVVTQYASEHLEYIKYYFEDEVNAEVEGDADIDVEKEAEERYQAYLKDYGVTQQSIENIYYIQEVVGKLYEEVFNSIEISDEEIQSYYDQTVREHEQMDEEDADAAFEHYILGEHDPELYVPKAVQEKAKYVKHILISLPEEVQQELYELSFAGDDEAMEKRLDEALAELLPQAQEVLEKAQSGEDFEALIEEYNQDPGMETETKGYLVYEGAGFVEGFLNASLELEEVGDIYPEPVESNYGYHIIRYESQPQAGPLPLEEVSAQISETLEAEKMTDEWAALAEGLVAKADIEKMEFTA